MFLRKVQLLEERIESKKEYPFTIPTIRNFTELKFNSPVTFLVGENGTGKSTLLEAIADNIGFNVAGGGRQNFKAYEVEKSEAVLGDYIRLSWMPKVTEGFFLRAETFYSFASHIDEMGYHHYGGKSLHEQSHGESFFAMFKNRIRGNAIYLLDEPEAALSPSRQLAFMRILYDATKDENAQFIIATHSPILLGFPGATIYSFDDGVIEEVQYEQTNHYQLTAYFLQNRKRMLDELFKEEE